MSRHWLPRVAERVILRRLRVGDLSDFQAYRTDPLVARFQGWNIISDAEARTFLEEMHTHSLLVPGTWSQIGIAEAASDRLIGDIGVRVAADESEAEIGISLAVSSQRRGFAVESLRATVALLWERTRVPRVVARCDTRNDAALRLMGRLGFTWEGDQPVMVHGEACVDRVFVLPRSRPGLKWHVALRPVATAGASGSSPIREWLDGPRPGDPDSISSHALILAPRADEVVAGVTALRIAASDDRSLRVAAGI